MKILGKSKASARKNSLTEMHNPMKNSVTEMHNTIKNYGKGSLFICTRSFGEYYGADATWIVLQNFIDDNLENV